MSQCPRCYAKMDVWVACEERCFECGGLLDCTDLDTNNK